MILENKVALGQVLFAGGSGFVGRTAVRWFRERHPSVRVLVGGRNLQAASEIAQEVGAAEAVAIDLDKPRLGLGDDVTVAAVVEKDPVGPAAIEDMKRLHSAAPARPGLYLPELLSDPKWFLDELRSAGATIPEDANLVTSSSDRTRTNTQLRIVG